MTNAYGQDIDEMYEAYSDRLWEGYNHYEADDFPMWDDAVDCIAEALSLLSKAEDKIHEAADYVDGSPEKYRIESLADGISELFPHINKQKSRMGG